MPSLLSTALLAASLAVATTTGAVSTSADFASGPSVVEVPLNGELEVRPAAGWHYADCSQISGASDFVTACSSESFTVTGGAYDAEIEPVRFPVRLLNGGREVTLDYVIRLAEPALPEAPDTTLGFPVPAGAVSLIPLSPLGLTCGLCSAGEASIEVGNVAPEDLGSARVTGSHLVYTAARDGHGLVEVDLRVRDDIENVSKTFKVMLNVSRSEAAPFHGVHITSEPGELSLEVDHLVATPTSGSGLIISECGEALYGGVTCTPGGEIHYVPDPGAPSTDQFAIQIVAEDGRQTVASVTLSDDPPPLAPGVGTKRAKLELTLPTPPPEAEETPGGATTGFTELMDKLGAR
ncbi:hypothetical protein [Leucobacter denitrificans]|uniref:Uncharacterized protein n=1 Tax=Leucobacter denitrificans TaxID=683042 RepID=A0A7G9S4R5_9MICO|nr:hypothetical protein [Leucobacter denitrificans]QNN62840.1 hypothetical protein H9L06_00065 [Leucobacter denitrificans]